MVIAMGTDATYAGRLHTVVPAEGKPMMQTAVQPLEPLAVLGQARVLRLWSL